MQFVKRGYENAIIIFLLSQAIIIIIEFSTQRNERKKHCPYAVRHLSPRPPSRHCPLSAFRSISGSRLENKALSPSAPAGGSHNCFLRCHYAVRHLSPRPPSRHCPLSTFRYISGSRLESNALNPSAPAGGSPNYFLRCPYAVRHLSPCPPSRESSCLSPCRFSSAKSLGSLILAPVRPRRGLPSYYFLGASRPQAPRCFQVLDFFYIIYNLLKYYIIRNT